MAALLRMNRIQRNRLLSPEGRGSVHAAGAAFSRARFLLWTTIGIRGSAVVMMAELRQLVVLTAVAGHQLPHCWRDGCGQERDCSMGASAESDHSAKHTQDRRDSGHDGPLACAFRSQIQRYCYEEVGRDHPYSNPENT